MLYNPSLTSGCRILADDEVLLRVAPQINQRQPLGKTLGVSYLFAIPIVLRIHANLPSNSRHE
jgi:hypothetical protein